MAHIALYSRFTDAELLNYIDSLGHPLRSPIVYELVKRLQRHLDEPAWLQDKDEEDGEEKTDGTPDVPAATTWISHNDCPVCEAKLSVVVNTEARSVRVNAPNLT